MCLCVILLESLSQSYWCAVFNVAARILDAAMAIPTVMAHLVSLLHRIVARLIAHRYIQHQCAYVLFYSNCSHGCFVVLFSRFQPLFLVAVMRWQQRWCDLKALWVELLLGWSLIGMYSINVYVCYFTRIALTVILLCCFQCCSQDFWMQRWRYRQWLRDS